MSYILDALKRAEHERTYGRAGTADDGGARADRGAPRLSVLILAGTTLFLAGVAITALLLRPAAPTPQPAASAVVEAVPPIPEPAAPTPAPAPPVEEPAAIAAAEDLGIEPVDGYETLDDVTPVFQGTVVATPQPPAPVRSEPSRAEPAIAAPAPTAAARTETVRMEPPPARPLREMPAAYRAEFPQLDLQVHVYDADPAKRWVMIDGRRYGEGVGLPGGPAIAEISAGGVVFEFRGERVYWPLAR